MSLATRNSVASIELSQATAGAMAKMALLALTLLSQTAQAEPYVWQLPQGMQPPAVPADNPMSTAKISLGRRLFFDIRLSGPGYMACATCHKPELAFTDGRKVAIGVTGQLHTRNTPTLANVAYLARFGWAQPKSEPLEVQLRRPMFGERPIEMGTLGHEVPVLRHIRSNSVYVSLFQSAFPRRREPKDVISFETVGRAIAAFQRTIVSANSAYDKFVAGDRPALSAAAQRGLRLFRSDRMQCATCHKPPFFTDAVGTPHFHNTGLYNVDGAGGLPGPDQGLANETHKKVDIGRFRTPTLRNISVTAPYMHDGSMKTLGDVVDHYASGGRAAQKGQPSPLRSTRVQGFEITSAEQGDLIAFLNSLTDKTFLSAPRYQTPYR
ncbi:MAG: cytochrome c peroxidase [Hyphomicrobiaceae bacterium]|jgi:cytochrome c peroxidase